MCCHVRSPTVAVSHVASHRQLSSKNEQLPIALALQFAVSVYILTLLYIIKFSIFMLLHTDFDVTVRSCLIWQIKIIAVNSHIKLFLIGRDNKVAGVTLQCVKNRNGISQLNTHHFQYSPLCWCFVLFILTAGLKSWCGAIFWHRTTFSSIQTQNRVLALAPTLSPDRWRRDMRSIICPA